MNAAYRNAGLLDVRQSLGRWRLVHLLAHHELKQRYRRSYLGTIWVAIGMIVWVLTVTFVFNSIFNLPTRDFLPYVAVGMVVWNFFSSCVSDSGNALINNQEYIKSVPLPLSVFVFKAIWLNAAIAAQNLAIVLIVVALLRDLSPYGVLMSGLGVGLVVLNVGWISLLAAIVCTRFRDMPALIANAMQILFYLTPVVWVSSLVPAGARALLRWNPLFHLLAVVRDPLLFGAMPWLSAAVAAGLAAAGWIFTLAVFGQCRRSLPYWVG
jgi:ABC-type polysaccharide/polyol phosphate export permease